MSLNRIIDGKKYFSRKYLGKNLAIGGILAGSIILAGNTLSKRLDGYFLNPEDFDNATWELIDNEDGVIWDDYMEAKIPHNQGNWHLYNEQIREKNHGILEGRISVPRFDDKNQSD